MTVENWDFVGNLTARHRGGYEVYSVDRDTMGYCDGRGPAEVDVDRGLRYWLYSESLRRRGHDASHIPITGDEAREILERIREGLLAQGVESFGLDEADARMTYRQYVGADPMPSGLSKSTGWRRVIEVIRRLR